ncbi:MAG: 6-bladed beta-propeller [Odoribacter splanchnicus]
MLKDILISMIIWVVVGCGNGSGVKRLDTRAVEKDTVLKWSQLVGESRLVRLETKEEALLNDYFRVWAGEKYIITYGNEEMYQFAADGTYIRKLASYGRAPGEYEYYSPTLDEQANDCIFFNGRQNSIR